MVSEGGNIMTLGNKIKKRRKELGLSQTELAEMTNISQPGISRLENGRYVPSSPVIVVLAKALRMSTDELLGVNERQAS